MEKITFSFGKNWKEFLKGLTEEKIRLAEKSLTDFLGCQDLKGKSFLDIGCGSGLFSYSAHCLGAQKIVSFDYDPFSVECCRFMHEKAGHPAHWTVSHGSVLDTDFVGRLGQFDIVYSWGVLHHTGRMWDAIRNAAGRVRKGGFFYIAIYNRSPGIMGSDSWLRIKRWYNASPALIKRLWEILYVCGFFIKSLVLLKNPVSQIRNYQSVRGMSFWTDVIDWLGGYPYEYATVEEILQFMKSDFPNYRVCNVKSYNTLACNSFLFQNL